MRVLWTILVTVSCAAFAQTGPAPGPAPSPATPVDKATAAGGGVVHTDDVGGAKGKGSDGAPITFAVFDVADAVRRHPDGVAATARLKQHTAEKQAELDRKLIALKANDARADRATGNEQVRLKKQVSEDYAAVQALYADLQATIAKDEESASALVQATVKRGVTAFARTAGVDIVIERGAVVGFHGEPLTLSERGEVAGLGKGVRAVVLDIGRVVSLSPKGKAIIDRADAAIAALEREERGATDEAALADVARRKDDVVKQRDADLEVERANHEAAILDAAKVVGANIVVDAGAVVAPMRSDLTPRLLGEVGAAGATVEAAGVVATVDLQRFMSGTRAGKVATGQLKTMFEGMQARLAGRERDIRAMPREKQAQAVVELKALFASMQREIHAAEKQRIGALFESGRALLPVVARERGVDLVLDTSACIVTPPIDLTDALIAAHDAR
jgi:Skp family chaperone for outer membrane proteins